MKSYQFRTSLLIHKEIHAGERKFKCNQCEKSFQTNESLAIHVRMHSNLMLEIIRQRTKSSFVNSEKNSESLFNDPEKQTEETKIFGCQEKTSPKDKTTEKTKRGKFRCDECDKRFFKKRNLNIHKKIHIKNLSFPCPICFKNFTSPTNLKLHEKTHINSYSCDTNLHDTEAPNLHVGETPTHDIDFGETVKSEDIKDEIKDEEVESLDDDDLSNENILQDSPIIDTSFEEITIEEFKIEKMD